MKSIAEQHTVWVRTLSIGISKQPIFNAIFCHKTKSMLILLLIQYTNLMNSVCIYPMEQCVNSKREDFKRRRVKPDNYADVSKIPTHCLLSPLPAATDSPSVQSSWLRHCPPGTFGLYVQKQKKGQNEAMREDRVTKGKPSVQSHLCTESQSLIRGLNVICHNEKHLLTLQNKIRLRKFSGGAKG